MAKVVPTILAQTPQEYQDRLDLVTKTSKRVHVDICDNDFVPRRTISLGQVHVPEGLELDLHLMVKDPQAQLSSALALKPRLIIIHSEAEGNHLDCARDIQAMGIKAGIAYLQQSQPDQLVMNFDHALVFTGTLGHYGGKFDDTQLPKLLAVKALNPQIETSVDGGVNAGNYRDINAEVLYAGSGYEGIVSER
jgi:pentose-5-phosphate-3-epimerase